MCGMDKRNNCLQGYTENKTLPYNFTTFISIYILVLV